MSWLRRRREPAPPVPVVQTMLLPNGQFLLVISELAASPDREEIRACAGQLPQLSGAAAVIVFDGPVVTLDADLAVGAAPQSLALVEDSAPAALFDR